MGWTSVCGPSKRLAFTFKNRYMFIFKLTQVLQKLKSNGFLMGLKWGLELQVRSRNLPKSLSLGLFNWWRRTSLYSLDFPLFSRFPALLPLPTTCLFTISIFEPGQALCVGLTGAALDHQTFVYCFVFFKHANVVFGWFLRVKDLSLLVIS